MYNIIEKNKNADIHLKWVVFFLQRIHCGCIVSIHAFTLLDPGGIECVRCARKNVFVVGRNSPI